MKATERKPTLEERLLLEEVKKAGQPAQHRRRNNTLPTLADIETAKLLWPDSKRLLAYHGICQTLFRKNPRHWTIAVTKKLDRLLFPELTQGKSEMEQERISKLSTVELIQEFTQDENELRMFFGQTHCVFYKAGKKRVHHKKLARLLAAKKAELPPQQFEKLCHSSLFANRYVKLIMDAVWKLDDLFLVEFGKALEKQSQAIRPAAKLYRFLLKNSEAVEQCATKASILKIEGFPKIDQRAFYHICDEVGLPVNR